MQHFRVDETVARRELSSGRLGTVVGVTDDGRFVTVWWSGWLSMKGHESTHRSDDLVRVE